jgi:hypothetical protein
VTLQILRTNGGEIGVSLADAFEDFPWRKFHWAVRALLQNSAVLKPFDFSFRRWLQNECVQFRVQAFPPTNFRRAVTFEGTYLGLSLVPSIDSRLITTKALAYLDCRGDR